MLCVIAASTSEVTQPLVTACGDSSTSIAALSRIALPTAAAW